MNVALKLSASVHLSRPRYFYIYMAYPEYYDIVFEGQNQWCKKMVLLRNLVSFKLKYFWVHQLFESILELFLYNKIFFGDQSYERTT